VDCWGFNGNGELGNGTTASSDVPVAVRAITNAKVVVGDSDGGSYGGSFCAVLATGQVKCWGYNNDGELGNGTTVSSTVPVTVKKITKPAAVVGGDYGFCAVLSTHHVDCWGYGAYGELGNGSFSANSDVPVSVRKITDAATVNAGNSSFCSLLSTGHVDCWGFNGNGELGNGNTTNSDVPVAVAS
jgi:alpha-tubulin suppressor-like RCC1 family protein